ncbi:MAG: glycoside hydrolase family 99-like domain-containing protein, partial [Phycisphaerae bacterium]|nr:glycoside hydrolase family 99-like domain-containing protein [Phycisphaerae bacterium]
MRWLTGLAVLAPLTTTQAADYVPPPKPCPSELTVGCFYFPGHFSPMRWMPFRQAGYPMPILGYYRDGEPEVSDWHIKWAVEHGIDFFAFDWYYHYKQGPNPAHNKALDEGFLRARYRDHMDFCLMWCNETKDERYTEQDMVRLAETLTQRYFSQANHLRIDGDNVLIVSRPGYLIDSFGPEGTARIFRRMAQVSLDAACGGIFPVANGDRDAERLKQAGFRATTAYNYPYAGMTAEQKKAQQAPYDAMVRGYESTWKEVTGRGVLPYIVPVAPGWDSRPWYGDR